MSDLERRTAETTVRIRARVGPGAVDVDTTDAFFDHMLTVLARYGGLALEVEASGDLRHHLIEDVGIALGTALAAEVPAEAVRFGSALVPMDDALVQAAIDLGGRAFYGGPLPSPLYEHFLQSMAVHLGATLHVNVVRGTDRHHVVEAAMKAVGFSLRQAMVRGDEVFSTKGAVHVDVPRGALDEVDELG